MANTIGNLLLIMIPRLPVIELKNYGYDLPESKIARYPLPARDQSKLLVYNEGNISHNLFTQIADILPVNSLLFFNNTKVIPARLLFRKESGAQIEVFLLSPSPPNSLLIEAMSAMDQVTWKCAVGNMKKWEAGTSLRMQTGTIELTARWHDRVACLVEFSWTPRGLTFADVVQAAGAVPLPPYIKRDAETSDRERYQTVYSHLDGAVAAPTAGLHFTNEVLELLQKRGVQSEFLTLHVSAGTFLPIKQENVIAHVMHEEQIVVHKQNIISLLRSKGMVVAVGTTALRTLESLYWYGALLTQNADIPFSVKQYAPYDFNGKPPSVAIALQKVLDVMGSRGVNQLTGHTSLFILPGYHFQIVEGLITNFHQPNSTLLLLISAFIGPDWKRVYQEALDGNYRFLSYGDSSLLIPSRRLIM